MTYVSVFYSNSFGVISQWKAKLVELNKEKPYVILDFPKHKRLGFDLRASELLIICNRELPDYSFPNDFVSFSDQLKKDVINYCAGNIVELWNGQNFADKEPIVKVNDLHVKPEMIAASVVNNAMYTKPTTYTYNPLSLGYIVLMLCGFTLVLLFMFSGARFL